MHLCNLCPIWPFRSHKTTFFTMTSICILSRPQISLKDPPPPTVWFRKTTTGLVLIGAQLWLELLGQEFQNFDAFGLTLIFVYCIAILKVVHFHVHFKEGAIWNPNPWKYGKHLNKYERRPTNRLCVTLSCLGCNCMQEETKFVGVFVWTQHINKTFNKKIL